MASGLPRHLPWNSRLLVTAHPRRCVCQEPGPRCGRTEGDGTSEVAEEVLTALLQGLLLVSRSGQVPREKVVPGGGGRPSCLAL